MKLIGHLKTIIVHKMYVFYYCFQFGLIWRGLVHDLSKFSPVEFFESIRYYTGNHSPIDECKTWNGYSLAWLHHKGRNKHHFEYWIDGDNYIQMPWKYATEMVCDYIAAGKAYQKDKFTMEGELKWWLEYKMPTAKMNEQTKNYVADLLELMTNGWNGSLKEWSKYLYNKNCYVYN